MWSAASERGRGQHVYGVAGMCGERSYSQLQQLQRGAQLQYTVGFSHVLNRHVLNRHVLNRHRGRSYYCVPCDKG